MTEFILSYMQLKTKESNDLHKREIPKIEGYSQEKDDS